MSTSIFALATSPARSALHIHRLTGTEIFAQVLERFQFKGKAQWGSHWHGKSVYAKVVDLEGSFLDDGIVTFFFGPHSFTGEDTIEFACHGNPLISALLQGCWRACGCGEAKPGEFTLRAFLNGKCDLSQAEAIGEIIHAKTRRGLELAQRANSKELQHFIESLKDRLAQALAYLEAHIDFAPDEVGAYDGSHAGQLIGEVQGCLAQLDKSYSWGAQQREGLHLVICGLPNAGKSTLFNALLGFDRAIVTDVAGTTRDTLKESLHMHGRDFVLVDTAGIRAASDEAERLGIERSWKALEEAQATLAVLDSTHFFRETYLGTGPVMEHLKALGMGASESTARWLMVFTKTDLLSPKELGFVEEVIQDLRPLSCIFDVVTVKPQDYCALQGALTRLYDTALAWESAPPCPVLMSQRQRQLVVQASLCVQEALDCVQSSGFPESAASCLVTANHHLEDIIGSYSVESIYTKIFSSFCIGK